MLIPLDSMTPAQTGGWRVLLDLYDAFPEGWCVIGGQIVWLLAREHGVAPIRATEDVDVVVDIRSDQRLIRRLCAWLESRDFDLEGISVDNIGHRYASTTYSGPGKVAFDILAPDNVGARATLTTSPPARTVSAPGTRSALDTAEPVEISGWRSQRARPASSAHLRHPCQGSGYWHTSSIESGARLGRLGVPSQSHPRSGKCRS